MQSLGVTRDSQPHGDEAGPISVPWGFHAGWNLVSPFCLTQLAAKDFTGCAWWGWALSSTDIHHHSRRPDLLKCGKSESCEDLTSVPLAVELTLSKVQRRPVVYRAPPPHTHTHACRHVHTRARTYTHLPFPHIMSIVFLSCPLVKKHADLSGSSEPMLTPMEKNALFRKKFSSEEDRTHDAASSRSASPTHYHWAIPTPSLPATLFGLCDGGLSSSRPVGRECCRSCENTDPVTCRCVDISRRVGPPRWPSG